MAFSGVGWRVRQFAVAALVDLVWQISVTHCKENITESSVFRPESAKAGTL
ncbi:hypothetical protein [Pseudomonas protegens]|uniref:hypothetical protein n=1 Tax=Pseudomonas protegens TaxID=380021 RepID=UPI00160EECC4|nr:hypothetical protein [Pseudomonas protegens]